MPLDNSPALIGEPRLTDAQVRTLRLARRHPVAYVPGLGWRARGGAPVHLATLRSLERMRLMASIVTEQGSAAARIESLVTPQGYAVLAAIARADAAIDHAARQSTSGVRIHAQEA